MEWLSDNVAIVSGKKNAAIVQLKAGGPSTLRDHSYGPPDSQIAGLSTWPEHVPWGASDNQPNIMGRLIRKNNMVRPLLEAIRDLIYGTGVEFFKRTITNNAATLTPYIDEKLQEWTFRTRLPQYLIGAINERVTNGNHFTRFEFDVDGLPRLSVSDSYMTRIGRPERKKPVGVYHLNPDFGNTAILNDRDTEKMPAFDFDEPTRHVVSMLHSREPISGNPFYAFPSWWGAEDWIELANLIPVFHKSGIKNGYNIKYLIRIPKDYFDQEGGRSVAPEQIKKKWNEFSENLSTWLSGSENVNKAMFVRYLRGDDGKALDSIDVVPLKNEMSDDAYSKVFEMANIGISSAVGILPTLAGVNPGKGNDSGSQIRVMADYQQHFRTPVHRQIILEPVQYALRAMGYKDIIPAVKGVQITTLDVEPKGTQPVMNQK